MKKFFEVKDLNVSIADKKVINGLNLSIDKGTISTIMGKNGIGKSTLAYAIMGHPQYKVSGEVFLDGVEILDLPVHKRAQQGIFLGFQHPIEVPGVTVVKFLQQSYKALKGQIDYTEFQKSLTKWMDFLGIDKSFLYRYLNEGFSGGEKKKLETLQLLLFNPKLAILDEPDSGLDVDALKVVGEGIKKAKENGTTVILITHYQKLLNFLEVDNVFVLNNGKIALQGDITLAEKIEKNGYDAVLANA
ncbi:Fe-S cluster assembly ATP-binding protein [Thermotomaculum hydrothermale]|uniref:Fe-S cluster assembly ATP-binding protein n=1 Tax=Thermotomaculum hydrothermale TaxID=981385 RepID=A0A7R6PPW1_9BACT|nr:Fe-S cluster assembly ATPase SufC [Thermotomaculum hydrothermale]BBB33638.1 Fe-S cluster assembly ATP-binding protein [Thermotomaculum hydrothermale]